MFQIITTIIIIIIAIITKMITAPSIPRTESKSGKQLRPVEAGQPFWLLTTIIVVIVMLVKMLVKMVVVLVKMVVTKADEPSRSSTSSCW